MSSIQNISAPLVNSPLVQSLQERDVDIGRAQNQFASHLRSEQHRQATETVHEAADVEQQGVDQDGHHENQQQQSQQQRQDSAETPEKRTDWRMGVDNDGKPHLVNVVG